MYQEGEGMTGSRCEIHDEAENDCGNIEASVHKDNNLMGGCRTVSSRT